MHQLHLSSSFYLLCTITNIIQLVENALNILIIKLTTLVFLNVQIYEDMRYNKFCNNFSLKQKMYNVLALSLLSSGVVDGVLTSLTSPYI